MKFLLCSLLCAVTSAAPLMAADGPTPYPDAKNEAAWPGTGPIRLFQWMVDNRAWFWTQRSQDQGAVVFVGDSLTGNWKDLATNFPGMHIANRGIGGDVSRGLLFRFKEDALDLKPKALVICIGSNDLSCHADPGVVIDNITTMFTQARAQDPAMPIILCQIPPRDSAEAPAKPGALADLNKRLAAFAAGKKHLVLLDLFTLLAGPDGMPVADNFAADRLHLAAPGYAKWASALKPAFAKLGIH